MCVLSSVLLLLAASCAWSENVTVVRSRLPLEEVHLIQVDPNVEYILDFTPTEEQSQFPTMVWINTDGGDIRRPLLVTYRQQSGANTWQLPTQEGGKLYYQMRRTLCPDHTESEDPTDCEGSPKPKGSFSLHAMSACSKTLDVHLRADPVRDWMISFQHPTTTNVGLTSPSVHRYIFPEEQEQVRLVLESEDDVCATVSVQNYTCPILQTMEDLTGSILQMTMTRSGAMQLSKSRFPRGFYVVIIVHADDSRCEDEEIVSTDWLIEAALIGEEDNEKPRPRLKEIVLEIRPALTRTQYVVACVVTVAVFTGFYVIFGAFVLLQRYPPFASLTAPLAKLAAKEENVLQSQTDGLRSSNLPERRRRRGSDATFDSSDMSDSESDDDPEAATSQTVPDREVRPSNGVVTSTPTPADANGVRASEDRQNGATGIPYPIENNQQNTNMTFSEVDNAQDRNIAADQVQTLESPPPPTVTPRQAPFGLPAELRVAALAKRRERVIRSRTDRYLTTLATVAVFYALPGLQLVFAFQIYLNNSGSLDTCYYNFLCAHPAGVLSDFNHVFSNLGYLMLGALFMLQLRRRQTRRKRVPKDQEYGIPAHYGLLASLGAGMMVVAMLSATYHICPNHLNFQFDTAFMYVLAVLAMVKMYQSRHPDLNARAHATFGVLAALIAIVVWGVLGNGALFWGVWTVLHVFTFLLLSLRIYYLGQFRLETQSLQAAAQQLRRLTGRPLYLTRLIMLLIGNAANWGFALYGLFTQGSNFPSHLLYVLLANTLLYMSFYLTMKLVHGERPRWYSWVFTAGAAAAWVPGLILFVRGSSSWSTSPAKSRLLNHECFILDFYDAHDLWHVLSAVALYMSFNAMLTWDDGLAAVPRTEIAVF